jgi:hypothetical protein
VGSGASEAVESCGIDAISMAQLVLSSAQSARRVARAGRAEPPNQRIERMSRLTAFLAAGSVALLAVPAVAQVKVLPGEHHTMSATVEAVEQSTRIVTLRDAKGELHEVHVAKDVAKFPEIKVGDKLNVTYYDNITIRKKEPGEADAKNTLKEGVTPGGGVKPVGTLATQQTITATISEIDMKVPSITFKGPKNWTYSTKVQDKKALESVKVGDKVDITWTEAMLVNIAAPK